jgi:hypothetical protein
MRFSWLKGNRFYSLHASAPAGSKALFVRTGANDPNFNLRSEQALVLRTPKSRSATFVSVIEPHGVYDAAAELTMESEGRVRSIEHVNEDGCDIVTLRLRDDKVIHVAVSHNSDPSAWRRIVLEGREIEWSGYAAVIGEKE